MTYSITPVTADRWDRPADFFGPSGAYAHCWCTWFRQRQKDFGAGARDGGAGNVLGGAVRYAVANGAAVVEGYPVDTTLRGPGSSGLFTGTLGMFTAAGFTVTRASSPARPVVQYVVGSVRAGPDGGRTISG